MDQEKSNQQYDEVIARCKEEFITKNKKYGSSLNAYDAIGVAEKILIKIVRIRTIQEVGTHKVEGEPIEIEFPAIINYAVYALILGLQIKSGVTIYFEDENLFAEYDKAVAQARELFQKKNHDYGEAWRDITISFMVKECHTKLKRLITVYETLKFENQKRDVLQKEYVEILSDILNYSIFCAIRISEGSNPLI